MLVSFFFARWLCSLFLFVPVQPPVLWATWVSLRSWTPHSKSAGVSRARRMEFSQVRSLHRITLVVKQKKKKKRKEGSGSMSKAVFVRALLNETISSSSTEAAPEDSVVQCFLTTSFSEPSTCSSFKGGYTLDSYFISLLFILFLRHRMRL